MYMPKLARFTARDPLPENRTVLLGGILEHAYAYANNNPANQMDPSGLVAIPATASGKCNAAISLSKMSKIENFICMCLSGDPNTKCDFMKDYGKAPVKTIKKPPPFTVKISTDPNAFFCGRPKANQYLGPDGVGPSVGFIVQIPDKNGKTKTVLHAHLSGDTWAEDLNKYEFPKGSHGVICGGDNSKASNCTMLNAVHFFIRNRIKFDGLVDWDGCFVGRDGKYYVREANARSDNDPKCGGKGK